MNPDTIVAPATAAGAAGLHVIRLSGPQAIPLADALFQGRQSLTDAKPRTLHYGPLTDGAGRVLDDVVVALFRAPNSYTREDVVEISTHGSDYIVGEVLAALVARGARLAGPGEFTQRAFLNGALDLAQAEAVADVIAADSALAHRVAVQQLRGGVSHQLRETRQELIDFAALLELELDFSEEDVEFANRPALTALLTRVLATVEELRATFGLGNAIKNGVVTVIAGRPNAGKSTLLNALVGEERAIVSSIAGTTRDLIEDEVTLGGLRFRFVDTAGLRETTDEIEALGVARTRARAGQAALLVYVYDLATEDKVGAGLAPARVAADVAALLEGREIPVLLVGNKADVDVDVARGAGPRAAAAAFTPNAADSATVEPAAKRAALFAGQRPALRISAHNPADIQRLKSALLDTARAAGLDASGTAVVITNARHHAALTRAAEALRGVLTGLSSTLGTELVAYDLRAALTALGEITGDVTPDDLLGSIFGRFCIGK